MAGGPLPQGSVVQKMFSYRVAGDPGSATGNLDDGTSIFDLQRTVGKGDAGEGVRVDLRPAGRGGACDGGEREGSSFYNTR